MIGIIRQGPGREKSESVFCGYSDQALLKSAEWLFAIMEWHKSYLEAFLMDMFRIIMRLFRQLVVQSVDLSLFDLGLSKDHLIIPTYRGDIIVTA